MLSKKTLVTHPNHTQHRKGGSIPHSHGGVCVPNGGFSMQKRGHQTCFKRVAGETVVRHASPLMLISLNCDVFTLIKAPHSGRERRGPKPSIKVLSKNSAESLLRVRTCARCDSVPSPHNPLLSLQVGTACYPHCTGKTAACCHAPL